MIRVLIILFKLQGCTTLDIIKESFKVGNIIKKDITEEKELTDEEKKKNNTIACIKVQPDCEW